MVEKALDRADEVLIEGRQRVQDLRAEGMTGHDLPDHLAKCGEELAQDHAISFTLSVIGAPQGLDPVVSTEAYRIGREALANAFTHSHGSKIEAELTYEPAQLSLRIRDDGEGMDQETLASGRSGHWGIPGMRERAQKIGARLELFSRPTSGTEVQLTIPARLAYAKGKELALWRRIIAFGSKRGRGA
jgi:signal transduction histidine kinase